MTKSTSSIRTKPVRSKIKDPVKPGWMRITKTITIILVSALLLLAIAGIFIRYFRLISKH